MELQNITLGSRIGACFTCYFAQRHFGAAAPPFFGQGLDDRNAYPVKTTQDEIVTDIREAMQCAKTCATSTAANQPEVLEYTAIGRVADDKTGQPGKIKKFCRPELIEAPFLNSTQLKHLFGISQASFVENDEQFSERVQFIHDKFDGDVIAEEYIEGREFYVSVLGNHRLRVFPIRELVFKEVPPDEPKIATYRAKWDEEYR
jgi:hypothetical protein